ncbi:visual pigment-like receptor peropsin [Saccostrea cucullata]|uniref:visual pigment-like receptor peropsin n=1 Tax=Saccostrea cuccullata TaxID=36930 RepID=UPI002ED07ADE
MASIDSGEFSDLEHKGVAVLYFLFGVLGVLTNSFVLKTFMKDGVLTSPKNILHVNLAFSNILVVLGFPFSGLSSWHGKWLFGQQGCQLYGVESYTGGIACTGFVFALCFERYLANRQRQIYDTMSSSTWWLITLAVWIHAFVWAILPVLGWSSYSMEASGVACGLNWLKHDFNHTSFVIFMTIEHSVIYLLAFIFLKSAKSYVDSHTILEVNTQNWFTEKQLVWITFAFLLIAGIGWGPYGYFAVWSQHTQITSISMLAVTLPPLFAKGSTIFYIIPYLVASNRFRDAVVGGDVGSGDKKEK